MPRRAPPRIVIFGASGRLGCLLAERFHRAGHAIVAAGRRADALKRLPGEAIVHDLEGTYTATPFIGAGDIVINAAHARYTAAIAGQCPAGIARLVVIGSARHLSRIPDTKAGEVRAAARFLEESAMPWVLLHPTMIYGAAGENNVQRMARLIRRFHVIPMPAGGRALIQPIHAEDVAEAVARVIEKPELRGITLHLGGPEAVPYRDFLSEIARACGTWVTVVPLPLAPVRFAALITRAVSGVPSITDAEVLRLQEDKVIDIGPMQETLGFTPRPLRQGLEETFAKS